MDTSPYSPPQAEVGDIPGEISHGISKRELVAFAGDSKYPELWLKHLEGQSRFAGFNGWATIFGVQWFFFRKLYVQGLISLVLEVGFPILFTGIAIALIGKEHKVLADNSIFVAAIAVRIGIGYWANLALCRKAISTIRGIDEMNLDNETHLRKIASAGGVSVPSLLAVYAALGFLRFAPVLFG